MKRIIILLMIVSLTLFVVGCSSGGDNEIEVVDVHTGSSGLSFDFVKNMPPDFVYSNQDFQFAVRLLNEGAYDIDNGMVHVTGDPGYITFDRRLSDSERISRLKGKTNYDPRAGEEIYTFDAQVEFADKGFEEHDSVLLFTACYDYTNSLSTEICIDPDVYNTRPSEKNCQVSSKSFSGQGGPVGISFIEPNMFVRNEAIYPQIRFTITNFGQGEAYSKGKSLDFCSSHDIDETSIGYIKLSRIEISDITLEDLDCFPDKDKILLKNNHAEIVCSLRDGSPKRLDASTDSYLSNIMIDFEYGYAISRSKTIKVKNQG